MIPLFPELRPYLLEVFEQAKEDEEYVITRYRKANCNLRTQLVRIIKKAGLKPWPKLFHNLRASRQTELAETYPIHVVCDWIGNSRAVAQEHYLQVTDDHFERAIGHKAVIPDMAATDGASSSAAIKPLSEAAQNPAQYTAEQAVMEWKPCGEQEQKTPYLPMLSLPHLPIPKVKVGGTGLEPVTPSVSCWCASQLRQPPDKAYFVASSTIVKPTQLVMRDCAAPGFSPKMSQRAAAIASGCAGGINSNLPHVLGRSCV